MDLDDISHNYRYCPWHKGVSWPWPKFMFPSSMSQCTHPQHPCPGHNSSLPRWIWMIFHTIIVHDTRASHDLDRRSLSLMSRSQCTDAQNLCPGHNANHVGSGLYFKLDLDNISHTYCPWPRCVMTLTQVHISNVKVTHVHYHLQLFWSSLAVSVVIWQCSDCLLFTSLSIIFIVPCWKYC